MKLIRKNKVRRLSASLTAIWILMLAGCGTKAGDQKVGGKEEPEVKYMYVALGDSIAAGVTFEGDKTPYPEYVRGYLDEEIGRTKLENLAEGGKTSENLLEDLDAMKRDSAKAEEKDCLKAIKNADYITISIGGNDVLSVMNQQMLGLFKEQGYGDVESLGQLGDTFSGFAQDPIGSTVKIGGLVKSLQSLVASAEYAQRMEDAVLKYQSNLKDYIAQLKELNPSAQIIVSTIYNPYSMVKLMSFFNPEETWFDMGTMGETQITKLNDVIRNAAEESGYDVAEVYEAFEAAEDKGALLLADMPVDDLINTSLDPHPTDAGQKLIAKVHEPVLKRP